MDHGVTIVVGALMIVVGDLTEEFFARRGVYPYQMLATFFVKLFGFAAILVGMALSFARLVNG